jgi:predicted SprT family Zn-dependent metalloprotease
VLLNEAMQLAEYHLHRFKLDEEGWVVKYDNARERFGYCRWSTRTISLSRYLVGLNSQSEVEDVILHEIAHALTPGQHHNHVWRAKCIEVGANPERCYDSDKVNGVEYRWVGTCNTTWCRTVFKRHRLKKAARNGRCPTCHATIEWVEQHTTRLQVVQFVDELPAEV